MVNKRRAERMKISVWVNNNTLEEVHMWLGKEFYTRDLNFKFCYSSEDISEKGIFLQTQTPLDVGSILEMDFNFPNLNETVKVKGKVVRIDKNEEFYRGMGVEFINLEDKYKKMINEFVNKEN